MGKRDITKIQTKERRISRNGVKGKKSKCERRNEKRRNDGEW